VSERPYRCPNCKDLERALAAEKAARERERAEHVNDVACGERRLIACEKERDEARTAIDYAMSERHASEAAREEAERQRDALRDQNRNLCDYEEAYREAERRAESAERREKEMRDAIERIESWAHFDFPAAASALRFLLASVPAGGTP
jgi:hypothetical protein